MKDERRPDDWLLEEIRRTIGYVSRPRTPTEWHRLGDKFYDTGVKKIKEAKKLLKEAIEFFRLSADCYRQGSVSPQLINPEEFADLEKKKKESKRRRKK